MPAVIDRLGLEGHDSELFSFLEPDLVEELQSHPSANTPLWTFGLAEGDRDPNDGEISYVGPPKLVSVTYWNTRPNCLAWTTQPQVEQCEPHNGKPSQWHRYRGFTTNDPLIQVTALVLLRHLFGSGYTCSLDDRNWIGRPADPRLDRLRHIRGYLLGSGDSAAKSWADMKAQYFCWVFAALNQVPTALGVAKMSGMIDRCVKESQ